MSPPPRSSLLVRLRQAPRSLDSSELQETFLVCAVTTMLSIRTGLWLTNYPQLGGAGLHIAHLLYGGILMVVAIGILLTLVGTAPRRPAAVIGGVGFGFFIDELGKFVTADNDYFFRPAAGVIYLTFVALYLVVHALRRRAPLSPAECEFHAIMLISEGARRRLHEPEKRRALALLEQAKRDQPLAQSIGRVLEQLETLPMPAPPRWQRLANAGRRALARLTARPRFTTLLRTVFVLWATLSVLSLFELVFSVGLDIRGARADHASDAIGDLSVFNLGSLFAGGVSGALVLAGLHRLRQGNREAAYRLLRRALLVSIFIGRVFSFVESQFAAVFGLAVDIVLLVGLHAAFGRPGSPQRDASEHGLPSIGPGSTRGSLLEDASTAQGQVR